MLKTMKAKAKATIDKKVAALGAAAAGVVSTIESTFCVDLNGTLNKTTDLVFTLLNWGGIIISVIGVVMIGKAIMDASSGQAQPGAVGKALGVLVLGVLMLAAKSVLTILGVQSTI